MTASIIAAAFLAIGNGADGVKIAQYPVTNGEYAKFVDATGHQPPRYWKNGAFPKGKERHPVLWVSFRDAEAYCAWLGEKDAAHSYRLPTEAEWETAAGETPRDAEFNFNGVVEYVHPKSVRKGEKEKISNVISMSPNGGVRGWVNHRDYTGFIYTDLFKEISDAGGWTTPVDAYPQTKAACGAFDMWGNCWEWTSTEIVAENGAERGKTVNAIKGGSWYATRRSCTTEFKGEGRRPDGHYNTVGFRVVQCGKSGAKVESMPSRETLLVRIAEIEVHPEHLETYLAAAKTVGAESVAKEPGVVCIFPMQKKEQPTQIRIVEIYRDEATYKAHLETPHFKAYKTGTLHMVKSLHLAPMQPLDPEHMNLIFKKGNDK